MSKDCIASAGAYSPFQAVGDLLYVSGQLPLKDDGSPHLGKVSPNLLSVLKYVTTFTTQWQQRQEQDIFLEEALHMYCQEQLEWKNSALQVSPSPSKEGEINAQTAKAAGKACALTTLKLLQDTLGSLDRVVSARQTPFLLAIGLERTKLMHMTVQVRIVKLLAMVNCTGDFKEPQTVANG